jgi:hypothetical protein
MIVEVQPRSINSVFAMMLWVWTNWKKVHYFSEVSHDGHEEICYTKEDLLRELMSNYAATQLVGSYTFGVFRVGIDDPVDATFFKLRYDE